MRCPGGAGNAARFRPRFAPAVTAPAPVVSAPGPPGGPVHDTWEIAEPPAAIGPVPAPPPRGSGMTVSARS